MHQNKRVKKLGYFPYWNVIFGSTISLVIIGVFSIFLLSGLALQGILKNNIELQVYLDHSISENTIHQLKQAFLQTPYLNADTEDESLLFISKETAYADFVEDTGEDFMTFVGDNPLRDAYVLKVGKNYHHQDSLREMKNKIQHWDGVYEVSYVEDLTHKVITNINNLSIILVAIALFTALLVGAMINNTIKLALFSQRFLIRSMQLVGASPSFIYKPFLWKALLYGFISGSLASGTIYGFSQYLEYKISDFSMLINTSDILKMSLILIIIGSSFSMLATFRSVRKYLKLRLDDLF